MNAGCDTGRLIVSSVLRRKLRPDVVSYTTLLHNLGQNGDIEGMMTIFQEMKYEAAKEDERLKEEKQKRKLNMEIEPLSKFPLSPYSRI
jgi:pentatricopeptide repeat protein